MRQKLIELKEEMEKSIVIFGVFNTPLSVIDKLSRQKISENTVKLNSSSNQVDLIDTYIVLHPTSAVYIFLLNSHKTFTKIDHTLVYKTYLKTEATEIIQCPLSDHIGIKLQINNRKITRKSPNIWRLNSVFLNSTWVKGEVFKN